MGASASVADQIATETSKPADASDVSTLEDAKAEIVRLRLALKSAAPEVTGSSAQKKNETVIITGPPAGGKGTQCEVIKELLGVVHLSTGDMLRENIKNETELGKVAANSMNKGELVPDEVIIGIIFDRLKQPDVIARGCLLDGFPRTVGQAEALTNNGCIPTKVIGLLVEDAELVKRVVGRRMDPVTGTIYHVEYKPPPDDEEVKGRLVQRDDDTEETARSRIATYKKNYDAIKSHYAAQLVELDGNRKPSDVSEDIKNLFEA